MTKREFFKNVINAGISEEMTTFAETEIRKLDERAENAKNSPKKRANEELIEQITAYLSEHEEGATASTIAEEFTESRNKISSLLTVMTKRGIVTSEPVKGSKGYRNLYKLAAENEVTE